jgi:hypothetical protein
MKFVFERIETQACWHLRMLTSADVPDQGEGKLAQWPGRAPPADLCPALFEHLGMTRMMMMTTTSLSSRIRPRSDFDGEVEIPETWVYLFRTTQKNSEAEVRVASDWTDQASTCLNNGESRSV